MNEKKDGLLNLESPNWVHGNMSFMHVSVVLYV